MTDDTTDETTVLQAVLDAIKGTLDPHTQIADHPNVKFAQMQRLRWMAMPPLSLRGELGTYLDGLVITGDNIGDIRRGLFMPFDSAWNGYVRDETAARERPSLAAREDDAMMDDDVTPPAIAALGEIRAACPHCGNFAPYKTNRGGYACAACGARFADLAYFQRVPPPPDAPEGPA